MCLEEPDIQGSGDIVPKVWDPLLIPAVTAFSKQKR